MSPRLGVIATHPIQYYAPLFRLLAQRNRVAIHVFYCWRGSLDVAYDPGFEQPVQWDVPLTDGYPHGFVPNVATDPGTHHFRGLQNPTLANAIDDSSPDAILVFGWAWQSHLQTLRRFAGKLPIFFRGDSTLLDERLTPRTLARRVFLRWVYTHVDVALYVGQENRMYYLRHGLRPEQLVWVPHSIDERQFLENAHERRREALQWRQKLGIEPNETVILFAGKLEAKKDPTTLLDAFLAADLESSHLVFAGTGPLEAELRERALEHPRIHFLGFQNQSRMPVVYRLGDLFILPSRGETWGLAVNEAMTCGLPVLVSDRVGCAADLVREGSTGAIFPAGNASALAERIHDLFGEPGRLELLATGARERIQGWSLGATASRLEDAVLGTLHRLQ